MRQPTILVIDNNPLTRKVVRTTLESDGYAVLDATNGTAGLELAGTQEVHLVLQSLVLPDADGIRYVGVLRTRLGRADIPIIALTGLPSRVSQARDAEPGFTDYILKPIEPSRLLAMVRSYLPPGSGSQLPGRGRRVLVVDDDPVQLKLLRLRLTQSGFAVDTATDGLDGLAKARHSRPDAIVSDMLMPNMDGFRFCVQVRQDAVIGHTPVVLATAAFIEDADRKLAEAVGATAFVVRTPNVQDIIDALVASLDSDSSAASALPVELPPEQYADRIMRQLERQVQLGAHTAQRLAWVEGNLVIIAGIAETLKRDTSPELLVDDILYQGLEAMGATRGAAYFAGKDGQLSLRTAIGFEEDAAGRLSAFFDRLDVVERAIEAGEPLELFSGGPSAEDVAALLAEIGATSILITPIASVRKAAGALVTIWSSLDSMEESRFFDTVVSAQVSQAIDLVIAFSQLGASEERFRRIVETAGEGIWRVDGDNKTTFVNARMANMIGYTADEILGRPFSAFMDQKERAFELPGSGRRTGRVEQHDCKFIRKDGTPLWTIVSVTFGFDTEGQYTGALGMVTDISDRKRVEESRDRLLEEVRLREAQAQVAIKELESFAYSVSHDLRAPLRHIDGFSKILLEDYPDKLDEQGRNYLGFIRQSTQTMGQLIDDLLELSRVTRSELRREVVNLSVLAESVVASLRQEQPERAVNVTIAPGVSAKGDQTLLRLVLQNLIENAWKFTGKREDANIEFGAGSSDGQPIFYVRDNGAGFDMKYADKLFGAFQRLHSADEYSGTGVGLATVQRIIHRHGGRIWAQGEVDKGATFFFSLPQ